MLVGYFNACNAIDNQNMIGQYDLALDKHWVTLSGYFRLVTTVVLGIGITDENLPVITDEIYFSVMLFHRESVKSTFL